MTTPTLAELRAQREQWLRDRLNLERGWHARSSISIDRDRWEAMRAWLNEHYAEPTVTLPGEIPEVVIDGRRYRFQDGLAHGYDRIGQLWAVVSFSSERKIRELAALPPATPERTLTLSEAIRELEAKEGQA